MKKVVAEGQVPRAEGGAVETAVIGIRHMVKDLTLVPGEAVRQEQVAASLQISRAPVREALRILQSEGILDYEANVGYTVRRLSPAEFEQMYVMRKALEDILLESLPRLTKAEIRELRALNIKFREAGAAGDISRMRDLNEAWHFKIFNKSPFTIIIREIERIWSITHPYRSFYLHEPTTRDRVVAEHEDILDSLENGENAEVIVKMDHHRRGVPAKIEQMYASLPLLNMR